MLGYLVQLDNSLIFNSESPSIVPCKSYPRQLLPNLIISLSRCSIIYQLILGFFLLNSTPSTIDALRPKNLTRLLIINNFYTTKIIRLIYLCLVLYSLLRSHREPLTTLRLIRNQYVSKTKYESIEFQSHETM